MNGEPPRSHAGILGSVIFKVEHSLVLQRLVVAGLVPSLDGASFRHQSVICDRPVLRSIQVTDRLYLRGFSLHFNLNYQVNM